MGPLTCDVHRSCRQQRAKIAIKMNSSRITSPAIPALLLRYVAQNRENASRRRARASAFDRAEPRGPRQVERLVADTYASLTRGIEPAVEQVGDQVREQDRQREEQNSPCSIRKSCESSAWNVRRAEPGVREHDLDDDGAADHEAQRQRAHQEVGSIALRTACCQSTLFSRMPLARTVVM